MMLTTLLQNWHLSQWLPTQIVEIAGMRIQIPAIASPVIRESLYSRTYEQAELELVKAHLQADDRVMEVGTGLGLLSSYCAKVVGNQQGFTFEANPALESAIRRNYALNQVNPHLEIQLVGEQTGTGRFYVGQNFWSSSILNRAQGARPIEVPICSFNQMIREINPTFLILDIEGGEYELVKYADFHQVKKLVIELHSWVLQPEQLQFVQDRLAWAGFELVHAASDEELYYER